MELYSCGVQYSLAAVKFCAFHSNWNQIKATSLVLPLKLTRGYSLHYVNSVFTTKELSAYGNGASEHARIHFERFFAQNKNLEQHVVSRDSHDLKPEFYIEILKSDLHATSVALKKREEEFQALKSAVLIQNAELAHVKQELERREKEINVASSREEKIKEEVRLAKSNFSSLSKEIEELNAQLKAKERLITLKRSSVILKEGELVKMRTGLIEKRDDTSRILDLMLEKFQLASKATEVVHNQEVEVTGLHEMVLEKEKELIVNMNMRKLEKEKLKIAEENLGKFTKEWLIVQEELNSLAEASGKHMGDTSEEFEKVKKHLDDMKAILIFCQRTISSARSQMEELKQLLEEQLVQVEDEKENIESYMNSLKGARLVIEDEEVHIKLAEARYRELELEQDISMGLIFDLQRKLQNEQDSLEQAIKEMSSLQDEIENKTTELNRARDFLQVTETKLLAPELEIKYLRSEYESLFVTMEEKTLEISKVMKKLQEVNDEVQELKILVSSKEEHIVQETTKLTEKDKYVQTIQNELTNSKVKGSEAEQVGDQTVDLTNNLVVSSEDGNLKPFDIDNYMLLSKQLKTDLNIIKMELLQLQKALAVVNEKLDERGEGINLKDENTKVREIHEKTVENTPVDERGEGINLKDENTKVREIHEKTVEKTLVDLVMEKRKLEGEQSNVKIVTTAIQKLSETTRDLRDKARLIIMDNDPNTGEK
ncbi:hypothetical protein ACFE04_012215 [Oxalis oulophora]